MQYRELGSTGLKVSVIAFGAGPVSQLLVTDCPEAQRATIRRALDLGVNWFDTAATYGDGQSEMNVGRVLSELDARRRVHLASKVRVMPDQLGIIGPTVRQSVTESLRRLGVDCLTLLQIHNSITHRPGAQPTSLSPAHVLRPGGMLDAMRDLQREGRVKHLGLTGLGEPEALAEVIACGAFDTIQIPYNVLNPSAGQTMPPGFSEADHGNLMTFCARGMGVFAIRVLAGGVLAAQPPSPHTLKTLFFPLDLYERDRRRADNLSRVLPPDVSGEEAAVRFALSHPAVTSAIIGFASPEQISAADSFAQAGPLGAEIIQRLQNANSAAEDLA